jgi:hypothetical protein
MDTPQWLSTFVIEKRYIRPAKLLQDDFRSTIGILFSTLVATVRGEQMATDQTLSFSNLAAELSLFLDDLFLRIGVERIKTGSSCANCS